MEKWLDIEGYEGYYQVSNKGRVKSLDREIVMKNGARRMSYGKILKPTEDNNGFLKVHLSKNDKKKMFRVHKLVADHFLCKKDDGKEYFVKRYDNDLTNNEVTNLYYEEKSIANSSSGKVGGSRCQKSKEHLMS